MFLLCCLRYSAPEALLLLCVIGHRGLPEAFENASPTVSVSEDSAGQASLQYLGTAAVLLLLLPARFITQIRMHLFERFHSARYWWQTRGTGRKGELGDSHLPAYLRHLPRCGLPEIPRQDALRESRRQPGLRSATSFATLAVAAARSNAGTWKGCPCTDCVREYT